MPGTAPAHHIPRAPARRAAVALTAARAAALFLLALGAGCTRTLVDEYRETGRALPLARGDQVVVLGRRHDGEYETEPELIRCIGARLDNPLEVVPEQAFIDRLYPGWSRAPRRSAALPAADARRS